jgi:hypothetical protein
MKQHSFRYRQILTFLAVAVLLGSCQKMTRPGLTNYPKDENPPGGPLKFFVAFDGATSNSLMNAVDSVKADFPSNNPLQSTDGISGKALLGDGTDFIKYSNANDFVSTAGSFTISFWEKRNGIPQGNSAFIFCFASSNGYWAGASMLGLFDWGTNNDSAVLKIDCIDNNVADNWFQWLGPTAVHGIMDNAWHHLAFVYDATSSVMTLYVDGVANPNTQSWGSHGPANMDNSKITEFDLGGNSNIPNMGWGQNWEAGNALDQFRLYGTALSASDVANLYATKQ